MPSVRVKICGLREPRHVSAAAAAGASYCGFVFFAKSPRAVSIREARHLALAAPVGMAKVALVVDPENDALDEIAAGVPLDMIQLHGRESAERVAEIKARLGLPVMKAVGLSAAEDLDRIAEYEGVADQILVDAKAPEGADLPGGNGLSFDWRLIAERQWSTPWMLAGGLTPGNVAEAIRLTGARQVDVSSGVENAPGEKDEGLIRAFLAATR